jgi:hypothetical protein
MSIGVHPATIKRKKEATMLIAALLHMTRRLRDGVLQAPAKRRKRVALRQLASLPPELKRDIGWPPERYSVSPTQRTHHKNRSITS